MDSAADTIMHTLTDTIKDHDQRIERLELAQESVKDTLATLRQEVQDMHMGITKQLTGTMLIVLGSVVLYIVVNLLGLK